MNIRRLCYLLFCILILPLIYACAQTKVQTQTQTQAHAQMQAQAQPRDVTVAGMTSRFYSPGSSPLPTAVLLIGGSEGQLLMADDIGPQLARLGYASLGVRYHDGWAGSNKLANVPIEPFTEAVKWLGVQADVKRVVVLGDSRGSEAALLTAMQTTSVAGVVAYVPSAYVWGAVGSNDPAGPSGWTLKGKPLTYVPPIKNGKPGAQYFLDAIAATENIEAATLPIEKIRAPLLLLGTDDDAIWPSGEMVRRMSAPLKQKGFSYPVTARTYTNAGHRLVGTGPSAPSETYKWGEQSFTSNYGGTAAGNLAARTQAWEELINFLKQIESGTAIK
jgi:dienelactone hydrolase